MPWVGHMTFVTCRRSLLKRADWNVSQQYILFKLLAASNWHLTLSGRWKPRLSTPSTRTSHYSDWRVFFLLFLMLYEVVGKTIVTFDRGVTDITSYDLWDDTSGPSAQRLQPIPSWPISRQLHTILTNMLNVRANKMCRYNCYPYVIPFCCSLYTLSLYSIKWSFSMLVLRPTTRLT